MRSKNRFGDVKRSQYSLRLAAFVLFMGCSGLISSANAAAEFGVNLELGVVRSDNIFLAPDGDEQSQTAYTIAPEFIFSSDEKRFQSDIRYQPKVIVYSGLSESNEVFHNLDASLTTAVLRDRLFLTLDATNFQTIVEPEARIPSGNLALTGNRTDVRVLQATPYWRQRIGQADLLIRGGYTDVEYDDEQFQSSNTRDGYLEIGNIKRQQGFAWQLDYSYRRTEYDVSTPWEFQRAALDLGAWINDTTRLFVVGGAETAFDNLYEPDMDADFWEAGIQYSPNVRLDLQLAAGERSYGPSFRGSFSYTLKRGQVTASYDEGSSNRNELLMGRQPFEQFGDLDGALDRPGQSDRFVRKYGQISTSIELAKSELTFRFFSDERAERTSADGAILDDEELIGIGVKWSWRFGRKTTLGIGGEVADRNYSGSDDEFRRARIDVLYQLSEKLRLRAEAARFDQKGSQSTDRDYTEDQIRFFLSASF